MIDESKAQPWLLTDMGFSPLICSVQQLVDQDASQRFLHLIAIQSVSTSICPMASKSETKQTTTP